MKRCHLLALASAALFFLAGRSNAAAPDTFTDSALEKFGGSAAVIEQSAKTAEEPPPAPVPKLKKKVPLIPADADAPSSAKETAPESASAQPAETASDSGEAKKDTGPPAPLNWHYMPLGDSKIEYDIPLVIDSIPLPRREQTYDSVVARAGMSQESAQTRISYLLHPGDSITQAGRRLTIPQFCEKISREGKECHIRRPYTIVETLLTLGELCLSLERNDFECRMQTPLTLTLVPFSKNMTGRGSADSRNLSLGFERYHDTLLLKKIAGPDSNVFEGPDAGKFLLILAAPFL